jgi:twitching motility protein PilT
MIDKINTDKPHHIITVEDPIEFLHPHKLGIVNQREIGSDTAGFKTALRYVLRQDPDVVLIGELRDLETVEAALSIAETGHLCLATLHTNGAIQTVNRIIDVFPPHQQDQVRAQLSFVLEGIVSQQLIPRSTGQGRCMALEVLVMTPAIRNLIRDNKMHQMYSQMQVGQQKYGMQTMNHALFSLLQRRLITIDEAISRSTDIDELRTMLKGSA